MAKFRLIDPAVWRHRFFKRQPWYVRDLFLYLFSAAADDEGRFLADPGDLLDEAFPRGYRVKERAIAEALAALQDENMILLYGEGYGFLTGWFEHQKLDRRYREESTLPAPPVSLGSWLEVERARELYKEARGLKGDTTRISDVVTWYAEATRELLARNPRESQEKLAPSVVDVIVVDGSIVLNVKGLLSEDAASDPEEPLEKPPRKTVAAPTDAEHEQEYGRLLADCEPAMQEAIREYVGLCAAANKTKKVAISRALTEARGLVDLTLVPVAEETPDERLTGADICAGVRAMARAQEQTPNKAPARNYVKKAALSAHEQAKVQSAAPPAAPISDEAAAREAYYKRRAAENKAEDAARPPAAPHSMLLADPVLGGDRE